MSADLAGAATASIPWANEAPAVNRFLVCAVAFLRAKQLAGGAKPRIDGGSHKPPRVAVGEVLADAISWSTAAPAVATAADQ